jgi:glycosyltransferase involved in cell wall biosynthesis
MERPRDSHAIVRGVRLQADHGPDEAGPDQEACVAFVGRMTVLKGGDLLVDAIAQASHQLGRSVRLLMIGDGPQRTAWEQLASLRGVPWTASGWLTGDDRWTALRQATVLALPSTWPEPFGLVGLEAAALGIPAVAFDVGGIREWLRPGVNGHLAPADPPRASGLAAALVRVLADPEQLHAAGRGAVAVAVEMSLARHLDRLEAIFASRTLPHAHSAGR